MNTVFGVVIGLIVITVLVVIHELGHAIAARRNGVIVEEFGIGFPPRFWSKKLRNGVLFSLNLLPLGGFVKLQGEHDSDHKTGDYGSVTFWQKTKILLAGVFMNWIVGAILLTILSLFGMPRFLPNQFSIASDTVVTRQPVVLMSVTKDSPAAKAGLAKGDKIESFAGTNIEGSNSLSSLAKNNKGKTVQVVYYRENDKKITNVSLRSDNTDNKGYLGASSVQYEFLRATWSAPVVGLVTASQLTWMTLDGLGGMLWNSVSSGVLQLSPDSATRQAASKTLASVGDNVAGPVGIFGIIFPAAEKAGLPQLILLSATISLTLAVMNILPIPALDGGRWAVMAIFRILKKPLKPDLEDKIHSTGFMLLMALVVVITIVDIGKFR